MPYHIRITPKSSRDRDEVRLDLTKEQLEDRYVIPYRESRPIVISGKTILPEDIERIRITYTDQTSQELLPIIRDSIFLNLFLQLNSEIYLIFLNLLLQLNSEI